MLTITITIETENAAFEDGNKPDEVERILRGIRWANCLPGTSTKLYDFNGNHVGSVIVKETK